MNVPTIPSEARRALILGVYSHHPVANLERLGLPSRVLNLLENSRIVLLEDLLSHSRDDLLSIDSLGERSLEQIYSCLARYDELPRGLSSVN